VTWRLARSREEAYHQKSNDGGGEITASVAYQRPSASVSGRRRTDGSVYLERRQRDGSASASLCQRMAYQQRIMACINNQHRRGGESVSGERRRSVVTAAANIMATSIAWRRISGKRKWPEALSAAAKAAVSAAQRYQRQMWRREEVSRPAWQALQRKAAQLAASVGRHVAAIGGAPHRHRPNLNDVSSAE